MREFIALLLQGIALGFSIAAPVGPIGVLCIRRSLRNGFTSGLASGLGAASADAVYGTIAAAGLTMAADFLGEQQGWLGFAGGALLLYMGVHTFQSSPPNPSGGADEKRSLAGNYLSTFLLTLSKPITIFSFIALFGGLSVGADFQVSVFVLVLGVFSGSALWWLLLSSSVSVFRKKISPDIMRWINRIAGLVILSFAVLMLWRAIEPLIK